MWTLLEIITSCWFKAKVYYVATVQENQSAGEKKSNEEPKGMITALWIAYYQN